MGEVYLGEKVGPEGFVKPVVLKCVLPQLARDRAFVQLFLDEARLAALLNHQHIAQVYDFGHVDNVYYMAMEYVPGYTVDDLRRKHTAIDKAMPIEHIAAIASQVCQGLNYAHTLADARGLSLGLVHRDVSPHNIIVSVDGSSKIVDFGIAKARAGLTRVQAKGAVGKFGYMSPEQSRGEQVDARTDVFSLGVCLWELVTNRRLHDAKIDRAPAYDPKRPIPPVTTYRRDVPRQFERILETALAIDQNERYATCQEMHLDIERFLAAMTHYAGQAALAQYLKDLAEGRVEQGAEPRSTTVEPAGQRKTSARQQAQSQSLEGAQRYEEVFGVSPERPSAAAPPVAPRAVPASWAVKERPPSSAAAQSMGGTPLPALELHTGKTPPPGSVGGDRARADRLARAEAVSAKGGRGSRGLVVLVGALVLLSGLGAAAFLHREAVEAWVAARLAPTPSVSPELSTRYRVVSQPEGATVFVDGASQAGVTPLVIDLNPGIEYRIDVRKPGSATKSAVLKASVGEGVRDFGFRLEPAATLKVTSEPPGATVEINGFEVQGAKTPITLNDVPGVANVRVTVSLAGKPPKTRTVNLQPGKADKTHFELDADPPAP
jgi:serine/threonine-protein kinase